MRFQVKSTVGPATVEPASGVPRFGTFGLRLAGLTAAEGLYGPQPLPVQAATMTLAAPTGTSSVVVRPITSRAATASAPPPGPAGAGWMTKTWYHSAPATALQSTVRCMPLSAVLVIVGA